MNREDIIRMYKEANGWSPEGFDRTVQELERFAALVAAEEKEACAKVCADLYSKWADELINSTDEEDDPLPPDAVDCKLAILARGQA